MNKEVFLIDEITPFKTRSEAFFPLDWYRQMLHHHPVYYHEGTDTWSVFKYEHVKQVLSNYEFFSSEGPRTAISVGANNKEGTIPDKINVAQVDPPQHRKRRFLLSAAFTPQSLKNWEPRIQQIVTELLKEVERNSTIDIIETLAGPLPAIVMADLLGIPSTDKLLFKKWADILFQPYTKENKEEVELQKQTAAKEYYQYLYPLIIKKRSNLSDEIISHLINVEIDGKKFTDDEIVRTTMLILGAGIETTSHMLGNTFYSLLYDNESLYEELQNNIELVPKAVEEMLRYRFHMSKRERTVKQDNNLLGTELKKGDVVIAWMSAANMDEEMFENPFSMNIHRPNNNKHLTFGNGPHICLGAPLARLEITLALKLFLQKFSQIESVPSFELEKNLKDSATGQTLTHLPLKVY